MKLYDFCLIFGPVALLLSGGGLFMFGSLLKQRRQVLYSYIFIFVLLVILSQIIIGLGLDRASTYPAITLFDYALVDNFAVRMAFRADWFSFVFTLPLIILTVLILFYMVVRRPLVEQDDKIVTGRLFGLIMMATGAALAAFYSADLIMMYFWQEVLGLILYLLAGPGLRGASSQPSSYRAYGASWFAGLFILIPFFTIIARTGGNSLYTDISAATLDTTLFGLVVAGAVFKAAQFPFNSIFNSSIDMPAGVYALLGAGAIFPLAVYVPGRLQLIGAAAGTNLFATVWWLLLIIGALTLACSGWLGLREANLARKTSWLVLAQMGFVTLGLGLGDFAMVSLQMVSLALFAPAMFICADLMAVEAATPPPNPSGKGLPIPVKRPVYFRPVLSLIYIISAIGATGLPFSPAYPAHWQIMSELLKSGLILDIACFALALFGIVLSLVISVQSLAQFLFTARQTVEVDPQSSKITDYLVLVVPAILSIFIVTTGFYPGILISWIGHFTTGLWPAGQNTDSFGNYLFVSGGFLALFLLFAGFISFISYLRLNKAKLVTPFLGGLLYGSKAERDEAERNWNILRGKEVRTLTVKDSALPTGFEDEFFKTGFRSQTLPVNQIEPRLPVNEFFGPLISRLQIFYQFIDTSFVGAFFSRIALSGLLRLRQGFEWITERFYAALAAFLLIILILLLTR